MEHARAAGMLSKRDLKGLDEFDLGLQTTQAPYLYSMRPSWSPASRQPSVSSTA